MILFLFLISTFSTKYDILTTNMSCILYIPYIYYLQLYAKRCTLYANSILTTKLIGELVNW